MTNSQTQKPILITAWTVILVMALFKIVLQEIFHIPVSFELQSRISVLIVLGGFGLTFLWKAIRPLRPFFGLFLVLVVAQWLVFTRLNQLFGYPQWTQDPSFNVYMLAQQSLNLMVTLIIIAFLFILKRRPAAFFLAVGDVRAPAEPISWLGVKRGETWLSFGRSLALFLSLGTLAFLVISGRPSLDLVVRVLPFVPAVLLAAALNAFTEEVTYKASFLSVLEDPAGRRQALLLMAAYFGILHYYGVPYGVVGVAMAALLGWLLGKSMLETRGMFWAWFLHFLQDVLIFVFMAIGSITPGG